MSSPVDSVELVGAIDQGTTSTRFILFDKRARIVSVGQHEHKQHYPHPGWVEHDPMQLWVNTRTVINEALSQARVGPDALKAIGITNQRETTVVWDRRTGKPLYNAIVWQDTRTSSICSKLEASGGKDRFRSVTGLPISPYFSATKLMWILDNVPGVRDAAERGDALFGNVDTWLLWNLTGGPTGGVHVTDVTNASRTMLMHIDTLDWDEGMLSTLGIPRAMLPAIRSSSEVYGTCAGGVLEGVPVAGILGDQQAALFGQTCFSAGEAKNTYGTGCFFLLNTGERRVHSTKGLLTTVAFRLGDSPPVYALEGGVAVAGALVQWLRDNLGLIHSAPEVEDLAKSVDSNGDVYFVPAFSGLFAPHWRPDARGVLVGLTAFANKGHIARAALESTAFQTRELVEAMVADSGTDLKSLKVDGGMIGNQLLMQFQADMLGIPVVRGSVSETTALGAAFAAGLATGYWGSLKEARATWRNNESWKPAMAEAERERLFARWQQAVQRSLSWHSDEGK